MRELLLAISLLGPMQVTAYRSVPEQTDDSPYWTSIGEHVNSHGVAVSQDLLKSGKVKYGDLLYIEGYGWKYVNDAMNSRYVNSVDIWVDSYIEEKSVGVRRLKVYKIVGRLK